MQSFKMICLLAVIPSFVKSLKDVTIVNGKPLKLEAVAQGMPKPTITWYKDEKLIVDIDISIESKDKSHSLSIGESSSNHTGTYKVVAENPAGKVESVSRVEIQTKPMIVKPSDIRIISGSEFKVSVFHISRFKQDLYQRSLL